MKHFTLRGFALTLLASGVCSLSSQAMASAFQLWEQDGASVGNYHAGYAALANDASTAFYNPAGLTRFKNQQFVLAADAIIVDFKYKGSISVSTLAPPVQTQDVTSQGGTFSIVPAFHYVTPLNSWIAFGFSIDAPFGLDTSYGRNDYTQFAATLSSLKVIDVSPVLAFQLTDKFSFGLGPDLQRMYAELDQVGAAISPAVYANGTNKANDTAYGYHLGALYEFSPETRVGISYHSQVVHHLTGSSTFEGPLVEFLSGGTLDSIRSGSAKTKVTLPAYTALSLYHRFNSQFAAMGSVIYTQWNVFNRVVLKNIAGAENFQLSRDITVNLPENYHNSWNFSLGGDYYATDQITLRGALGYDQTPLSNRYRDLRLPDNDRYVIALGGHYQATKAWGFDLGWTHLFLNQVKVNPPPLVTGGQTVIVDGHSTGGADVIGAQVTWDLV